MRKGGCRLKSGSILHRMALRIDSPHEAAMTQTKPILYTYPGCGYTTDLKRELKRDGVEYEEVDLSVSPERIPELLELTDGHRITPVYVVGDEVQIGKNGFGCSF